MFARDAIESPLDTSVSVSESTDRVRLLIGIVSTVGIILFIALVFLLLWSRHYLHAGRQLQDHNVERDVPTTRQPKDRVSSLRRMLLCE